MNKYAYLIFMQSRSITVKIKAALSVPLALKEFHCTNEHELNTSERKSLTDCPAIRDSVI